SERANKNLDCSLWTVRRSPVLRPAFRFLKKFRRDLDNGWPRDPARVVRLWAPEENPSATPTNDVEDFAHGPGLSSGRDCRGKGDRHFRRSERPFHKARARPRCWREGIDLQFRQ